MMSTDFIRGHIAASQLPVAALAANCASPSIGAHWRFA
jgi:hypothetical protein